jgi:DNA processing protein
MNKGLNIDIRHGWVSLALALASRPDRAAKLIARYQRLCLSSDKSPHALIERFASRFKFAVDWSESEKSLLWGEESGNYLILRGEAGFPPLLDCIPDAPNLLFVKGDKTLLSQPQVAMVGSRKATHYGLANAHDIAMELSRAGFVVTSGLAIGIDGQSHTATLECAGKTIAVLGTGIEKCYPRRHRDLFRQIAQTGALVSEFPIDWSPRPYHFPRRNRIISGLSIAVVVVEANIKSGSLTTANHAAVQGREVFAIPGSIRHPSASGCHKLIADGAHLVESTAELIRTLREVSVTFYPPISANVDQVGGPESQLEIFQPKVVRISDSEQQVLSLMGGHTISFDELVMLSGLTTSELSSILSALELHGLVRSSAGDTYTPDGKWR